MEGVFRSYASADSGGEEFLGTIPGSLLEVKKRKVMSSKVRSDPMTSTGYQEMSGLPSLM